MIRFSKSKNIGCDGKYLFPEIVMDVINITIESDTFRDENGETENLTLRASCRQSAMSMEVHLLLSALEKPLLQKKELA